MKDLKYCDFKNYLTYMYGNDKHNLTISHKNVDGLICTILHRR
jgi:hypothetical protein